MTTDETQSSGTEEEKTQLFQFIKWIIKVLYSPVKTFEEIVKKPNIKGPILILLITLPIIVGGQFVFGAKFFSVTPEPEKDLWTEQSAGTPSFIWTSNDNVVFDGEDYIVGNNSVSASMTNSSSIWMRLTNIGRFDCSEGEYDQLFFRIIWVNEANVTPAATVRLFSMYNESRRFELDLGKTIANRTGTWANVSVNLDTDEWIMTPENLPDWENITGVGFELTWDNPSNITMKIDDLLFGKYIPLSSFDTFNLQLLYSLMRSSVDFLLQWVILSGIVLLALKSFSNWNGTWRTLLSIVGYVYSVSIVYFGLLTILFLLLPPLFFPYNITYSEYVDIYQTNWGIPISALSLLSYVWTIVLCTIALRKIHELSLNKAFLIGFGAFIMSLLLSSFLLGLLSL